MKRNWRKNKKWSENRYQFNDLTRTKSSCSKHLTKRSQINENLWYLDDVLLAWSLVYRYLFSTAVFRESVSLTLEDKLSKLSIDWETESVWSSRRIFSAKELCPFFACYLLCTCWCSSHPLFELDDRAWRRGLMFTLNVSVAETTDLAEPTFFASAFSVSASVRQILRSENSDNNLFDTLPNSSRIPKSQNALDALTWEGTNLTSLRGYTLVTQQEEQALSWHPAHAIQVVVD